ncbi:hypothetical protein AAFC00_004229 [Neodothiora populina]|uniref:Transcription factor BYE1 n=1 Tax=Neodothiora populina TaxID=2781224 RepID=A0ABR3PJ83_9PEZI
MAASAADEPRRSGRATKGQHKNLDGEETPKPGKKAATPAASASKKSAKKSAEPEPEPEPEAEAEEEGEDEEEDDDDDDEEEERVRCVCGDTSEKGPPDYVQCDACQVWQHNICLNLPLDADLLPDNYLCEQCSPDDHKDLLAAMARGEKPWEDRLRAWRNAKKKGKGRRKTGDRQSTASELKSDAAAHAVSSSPAPASTAASQPPAAATPTPAPSTTPAAASKGKESGTKRKFEEDEVKEEDAPPAAAKSEERATHESSAPAPTPTPAAAAAAAAASTTTTTTATETTASTRRASSSETKRAEKRRKSSAPAVDGPKKPDPETALVEIDQLPLERKKAAEALSKVITDDINSRVKAASYRIPDGHTATSLGRHHASRIEYALYMNHGPKLTESYSTQFRALLPNLKRNNMLIERLLKSDLTADELAVMKPEDMASEEEQKKRAALKEEVEKQSVMVQEDEKPRMRRTHKGDEYVDDESTNQTAEQSVFASRPVRHRESDAEAPKSGSPTAAQNASAASASDAMDVDKPEGGHSRRTSSQQFDIGGIWAKTQHTADGEQGPDARPTQQPSRRRSSIQRQAQQEKGEKVDADVDRLLADDDNDDEEYNPAELGLSDGAVWRGELVQPGVTQLTTTGRFVAGNDFGRYMPWTQFLPRALEIEGRLEARRADDYLCGLQWSRKSDVAVLALSPYNNRPAFDQIFDYFASRSRYAVIRKGHGMSEIVKDVYISPVEKGGPLPPHIGLLEHSSLDASIPDRILLVTFVVNKPAHWDNPSTAPIPLDAQVAQNGNGIPPHLRNGPVASPINSQPPAPAFSPAPPQTANGATGFPYSTPNSNAIPPNPYGALTQNTPALVPQYPGTPLAAYTAAAPPHPNPLVARILGPLANAPTVQHILQSAGGGEIAENILQGMKTILTTDPSAAEDLGRFSAHLGLTPSGASGN